MAEYIDLDQARDVLEQMGIRLTRRQIKRASDKNAQGRRKLPFFIDPIEGRLKIEKNTLVSIYNQLQLEAQRNLRQDH